MFNFFYDKNKRYIEVSPSIIIFTVFFLLALYFTYQVSSILVLLFLAFIFMLALNPAVKKVQRRVKSKIVSIVIVYALVFIVIISLLAFLLPPLVTQLYQLLKSINLPLLQDQLSDFQFTLVELGDLANKYSNSLNTVISIVSSTFSSIFTVVTLLVMSFYLMIEHDRLHLKVAWFSKKTEHIALARKFLDSIEEQLGGWIRAEVILMSIIGIITYIALLLMGVPYALPLAILAGMLELLPNLGPTISAFPAILIAYFNTSPLITGLTVLFYILVQQFENNLIVPRVMQKNANVNPLMAILSILCGFKLYSVVGALLAVPTYIVARTIYSFWWKYHKNGS